MYSNWKYEWLRPSADAILKAYEAKYGSVTSSFRLAQNDSDEESEIGQNDEPEAEELD